MGALLRCPVCVEEGEKSRLIPSFGSKTMIYCAPYIDKKGVRHHHDRNASTTKYKCSRGHRFTHTTCTPCPGCGWKSFEDFVTVQHRQSTTEQAG